MLSLKIHLITMNVMPLPYSGKGPLHIMGDSRQQVDLGEFGRGGSIEVAYLVNVSFPVLNRQSMCD